MFCKPRIQLRGQSSFQWFLPFLKQCYSHSTSHFNRPKPSRNLTNHPLNLGHPILSKLKICKHISQFNQIHAVIITTGLFHNPFAASRLIVFTSFSLDPPNISLAYLLFGHIQTPDVYTYNTMIKAFSQTSHALLSISLYNKMLLQGLQPNEYTFCFLFTSCAHGSGLKEGQQFHSYFLKHGFNTGVFASTSLVHMYSECGELIEAIQVFDEMPQRSDVSWGAMMDGYVRRGFLMDGLEFFADMRSLGIEASNAMLVSALGACARLQYLVLGRMVHGYINVKGLELNMTLGTSLVDMYSKCGAVKEAMTVFSKMHAKSVASWNCIIYGLALNGQGDEAINLFKEMQTLGVKPNGTTFVGVLHSCSHRGLVADGLMYFTRMCEDHAISPNFKHYGCMVDLYGRAERFEEALEVIRIMPMKPDVVIWGALLGACRIHGQTKLGELVVTQLMKLQPFNIVGCTSLSDMYAMDGQWEHVAGVRRKVIDMDILRGPGFSALMS